MNGERVGIRTRDPLIKSQMLYQLSYAPTICGNEGMYNRQKILSQHKKQKKLKKINLIKNVVYLLTIICYHSDKLNE